MQIIFKREQLVQIFNTTKCNVEYFGKISCYSKDNNYYIDKITFPREPDELKSFSFIQKSDHHDLIMQKASIEKNSYFIGTWHSHRCFWTTPSSVDIKSFKRNYECTLFHFSINIIVTSGKILFILIFNNEIKKIKFLKEEVLKGKKFYLKI